jgi:diguanylate cyclase (GGDEF)-like protein
MPEMDGLELVRQIRRQHRREDLAIIALSDHGRPDLSAAMLKAGANDYLNKHFQAEEFYCRVVQNTNMVHYVRELHDMANRDYLTRLHNRRHLFQAAEARYQAVREQGGTLAVAMIDADHFKCINDQHGHAAGDEALKRIARVLRRNMARDDIVARYGGEEFVCVVALDVAHGARQRFESLRAAIAAIELEWAGAPIAITVSIGFTTQLGTSLTAMIDLADQAVFHAKAEGRNRVIELPAG